MKRARGRGLGRLTAPLTVVALVAASTVVGPALATEFAPENIIFPVVGDVYYSDTFGAPRGDDRTHEGIDIMSVDAVKGLPVVAADDGTVAWVGATCCYLAVDHGGGWETWYIHLDNDTPGTDDGLGWGIADGIEAGAAVTAGQLIGWVGDSGNAEATDPHLHFEIRFEGVALNPYPYLVNALVLNEAGEPIADPADPGTGGGDDEEPLEPETSGFFVDDDESVHETNIDTIFELGITKGCNPPLNDRYCPGANVTRGETAAFLRRVLELPATEVDAFVDDAESIFEGDINALAAAGIAFGCSETDFCPNTPLLREEMAEFLVRTFASDSPEQYVDEGIDWFGDDAGSVFEESINRLKSAGVTVGCNPPENDESCPTDRLTRAQMATFLARALGYEVTS